jgi:hypothetical protein
VQHSLSVSISLRPPPPLSLSLYLYLPLPGWYGNMAVSSCWGFDHSCRCIKYLYVCLQESGCNQLVLDLGKQWLAVNTQDVRRRWVSHLDAPRCTSHHLKTSTCLVQPHRACILYLAHIRVL